MMTCDANRQLLAIDVGNTAIKLGRFARPIGADDPPLDRLILSSTDADYTRLHTWLDAQTVVTGVVASVCRPAAARLHDWLDQFYPNLRLHDVCNEDFPIDVQVRQPERVGHDRLAAAVAAAAIKPPEQPAIIVDAGSAITVDRVSTNGAFQGGAILPGWQTMAASLQQSTDQLPCLAELDLASPPPAVGRTTEEAIASGLFWGCVGAVRELIGRMTEPDDPPVAVFLAGGGMPALAQVLDIDAQCEPDLVLRGIAMTGDQIDRG